MQLFVMRHGQASPTAPSDQQRPLTVTGEKEASLMGKWLSKASTQIDCIVVSPYVRAQQTAKLVQQSLPYDVKIETLDMITPSGSAPVAHDYLDGLLAVNKYQSVLFVSHMPFVSYFVAELTYDGQSPIFQTAGIAQINYDVSGMKGELDCLISPFDLC